jgi:uncharacterized protein involved in outer membrane biogenesis
MHWRRLALWLISGFFSILVLAVAWLWMADLGVFKPQVERFVSDKIGREFAIDGNFQVDLTRHSEVIAEDVRLANADWADEPQMVEIGKVKVRFDLWSLIRGPIIIELIDIDDVEIHLARREDGDPNWTLPIQAGETPSSEGGADTPFQVLLEQVELDRASVIMLDPSRSRPLDLQIASFRQQHRKDDFLRFELDAMLNEKIVRANGDMGTWDALLTGRDIRFDIDATLHTLKITGEGHVDDLMNLRRPSIEFTAAGPNIDDISRLLGISEEGDGNIDLTGSLVPQENGPLVLSVKGNLGLAEIEAGGEFSDLQNLENVDFDIRASGPNIGGLLSLAGIHGVREVPFTIDGNATRRGTMFVVNRAGMELGGARFEASVELPNFPTLDDGHITLDIGGPNIEDFRSLFNLPGAATGAFAFNFNLDDAPDGSDLVQLNLRTSLGELSANGQLGDAPSYRGSQVDFELKIDNLARTVGAYQPGDWPEEPATVVGGVELVDGAVRTLGPITATAGDLIAKLNGDIRLGSGAVGSDLAFDVAGSDLAALIGVFGNPTRIPAERYNLKGSLQIDDSGYRFRDVSGNIGSSTVALGGLLANSAGLAGTEFDFKLTGQAFEEIIVEAGDLQVHPGPYTLSGRVKLQAGMLTLENFELDRERGELNLDLELGLPVSRRWADFDLSGRGEDIRAIIMALGNFEANAADFSLRVAGKLRGTLVDFDRSDINVADAMVRARGELDLNETAPSTRFVFSGNVPSLEKIGKLNGRPMRDQGLTWDALVVGGGDVLRISELHASLGDNDIHGTVLLRKGDVPEVEVHLTSDAFTIEPLVEEPEPEPELENAAKPQFTDGRLVPDLAVPFDAMAKINASVSLAVGEFVFDALYMRNLSLQVELRDGALDVTDASFDARSGRLQARAALEPDEGAGRAAIQLIARNFAPGMTESNRDLAMTGNIDLKLESTGTNLRELLGNANGMFFLDSRGGRFGNNRILDAVYGNLWQEFLSSINPFFKRKSYTDLECIVMPIRIVEGNVSAAPNSYIATDKIRISLKSKIDLKTEKIDINVRTTPKKGITLSAAELLNPYVKLVGTLASPRLAVDETGALTSGGVAVATGGVSILARAAWDRLKGSGDPCAAVAKGGREALTGLFPDLPLRVSGQDNL